MFNCRYNMMISLNPCWILCTIRNIQVEEYLLLVMRVFATLKIGYPSGTSLDQIDFAVPQTLNIGVSNNDKNNNQQQSTTNKENTIDDIETGLQMEKQQVTTFADDATVQVSTMGSAPWHHDIPTTEMNDIRSILQRPVRVAQGTWSNNDAELPYVPTDQSAEAGLLSEIDFPDALFATSSMIREKLDRFAYFSANIVVRVMVNGQPFQNGKLLGLSRPFYDGDLNDISKNHKSGLSSFQHVEIDISEANTAELKIPFCAPYNAWDLTNYSKSPGPPMATFQLYVINQLLSGTAPTSAEWTIYAWFEDIKLTVPTAKSSALDLS